MNKSLEFVINRMTSQNTNPISEDEYNISINKLDDFMARQNDEILCSSTLELQDSDIVIEIKHADKNFSDFDYYASHCEHNDGTLAFVGWGIEEIVKRLLTLKSFPVAKIKSAEDLIGIKKIEIKIGDVVICQKIDESPVKEKPWMTNRLEIFIPVHFELIKNTFY